MKLLIQLGAADLRLFHCLASQRSRPIYRTLARFISKSADGEVYLFVLLVIGLKLTPASLHFVFIALVSILIERLLYFILKNGLRRARPANAIVGFESLVQPNDRFSFPSGHTSAAFMFAVLMGQIFPNLLVLFIAWAALVAYARVLLGVHYPFDTLVGAALGCLVGLTGLTIGGVL